MTSTEDFNTSIQDDNETFGWIRVVENLFKLETTNEYIGECQSDTESTDDSTTECSLNIEAIVDDELLTLDNTAKQESTSANDQRQEKPLELIEWYRSQFIETDTLLEATNARNEPKFNEITGRKNESSKTIRLNITFYTPVVQKDATSRTKMKIPFYTPPQKRLKQTNVLLDTVKTHEGKTDSENVCLLMAYALLSSKEEQQHSATLKALKDAAAEYSIEPFHAQAIMTDFELGIINAAQEVYLDTEIHLCFFYLKQNLYKEIQKLKLQKKYNEPNDSSVRDYATMIAASCYAPAQDVVHAFKALKPEVPAALKLFVQYFNLTCVNGKKACGRQRISPPLYPVEEWNQYDSVIGNEPTTNNASEGWHNRCFLLVGKSYADLYSLKREFQKEHGGTEIALIELSYQRRIKSALKKK
ncbi:hypothetical protein TKK_0001611 [Trichogramma kaykai]